MEEWETGWSRDVLERIVALLFSLADIADIAAGLPAPRRRHILGILSVGETEAWAFLIGTAPGTPAPTDALDSAGDAERLAARLRTQALLLIVMLLQRLEQPGAVDLRTDRETPARQAGRLASLAAPDTS